MGVWATDPLEARVTRCTGRACYGRSVGAQSGVHERAASHGETWVWGQTDVDTGRFRYVSEPEKECFRKYRDSSL